MRKAKRIIIIFAVLLLSIILFNQTNKTQTANPVYNEYSLISVSGFYSEFINIHNGDYISDYSMNQVDFTEFSIEINEELDLEYYNWSNETQISMDFTVEEAGLYLISFDYVSLTETHMPVTLSLKVNGDTQYEEQNQIILDTLWYEESNEMSVDRYGNDILNEQSIYNQFLNTTLRDTERLYEDGLYVYLEQGTNDITFNKQSGHILLSSVSVFTKPLYLSYDEYSTMHSDKLVVDSSLIEVEAEDFLYKNSSTIVPGVNRDPLVTPFSITKLKLNVMGTDTYDQPGDSVTWQPNIEEPGMYQISFKVEQNTNYRTMFRTLYVNNEIPFDEAKHLIFEYNSKWNNITLKGLNDDDLMIYLEPGDTVTLEVDGTLFNSSLVKLESIASEISSLGLDVTKLTKNNTSRGIDWDIPEYFPTVLNDIGTWINDLEDIANYLQDIYGYQREAGVIKDLKTAIIKLESIKADINELPRMLNTLSTGTSSALQLISSQTDIIKTQKMVIDVMYIHSSDYTLEGPNASFMKSSSINVRRFFMSFFDESYSSNNDEDVLEIWVNRPRQYSDIIQQLADSDFTEKTGITVKISIIKDDSKLLLANSADKQPDVALGISAWIPNEYGMRGMLYDMRLAEDYQKTTTLFSPEQLVPMVFDNHLYGLPETENFYVLFYRKDILDELELDVPSTWEDVVNLLPVLNRHGMSYYIPLSSSSAFKSFDSTAPFIYQFGGDIYSEDGFSSAINDDKSIEAIEFMTDLYLEYGTQVQISSFFNSFRNGTVPLGIGDFGMYLQLTNAASDIRGLWDIALVPGMEHTVFNQETNTNETIIDRSMPGAQQVSVIFEKSDMKDEAWVFLSWWMSTETQDKYSERLLNTLGSRYIWNSANMKSFENLRIEESHKETILEQWEHLREIPKIPGSYIIEREISNIWNNVVFNDSNLRSAINDAIIKIDKELTRKMKEFEYLDSQGNIIKEFILPTKEDIEQWSRGE